MTTRTTKIVTIIAALYLFSAVCALGFVLYNIQTSGNALEERVNAIADTEAKLRTYAELNKLIKETEQERTKLTQYVLTDKETSSFLTNIESIAQSMNVEFNTDSLSVVEKEGLFNDLSINFSIAGREDLVLQMITLLESLPYHSSVTSLTFSREAGMAESSLELVVTLSKYEI